MVAISGPGPLRPLHPLHAILLAFPLPLFLGALLSDLAYRSSFHVQWANFSSWLIAGGLLVGAFAVLWALVNLFRRRNGRARGGWSSISSCCSRCGCSASSMPSSTRRMPGRPCRRASIFGDHGAPGARGSLDRLFRVPCRRGEMMRSSLLIGALAIALSACGGEPEPGAIWPQPGSARTAARPVARHEDPEAGQLGRRSPDGAAGIHDSSHRHRSQDPAPDPGPSQWRHSGGRGIGRQRADAAPQGLHRGLHQESGQEFGEGRRSADAAARRRWRRHLRDAGHLRRQSQCALRSRAGQRRHLRRQPGCAGALRLS